MGLDGGIHVVSIADSFVDADRPYLDIDSVRLDLVHSSLLLMGVVAFLTLVCWWIGRLSGGSSGQ